MPKKRNIISGYRSNSPRQNDTRFFSPNFLVTVFSSVHNGVVARLPEELQMSLTSEWDTPLLSSGASALETLVQNGFGKSTRTQFASAQVWSGSSPIEITLPLEFYAEENPKLEVVEPIVRLSKMALPRRGSTDKGLFTPPGPRIFKVDTRQLSNKHDDITISVGNFLTFNRVIITNVNPTFITRDMTQDGLPLRATCEVTFRSMFSLSGDDFSSMFNDIN